MTQNNSSLEYIDKLIGYHMLNDIKPQHIRVTYPYNIDIGKMIRKHRMINYKQYMKEKSKHTVSDEISSHVKMLGGVEEVNKTVVENINGLSATLEDRHILII